MVLAPVGLTHAAGAGEPVYDAQLELHVIPKLGEIKTNLDGILEKATQQLELAQEDNQSMEDIKKGVQDTVERLDSLLERIGNPADVSMDDISRNKFGDVQDAVSNALEDGIVKDRPDADTGDTSIFSETGGGIIKEIKGTYEYQKDSGGDKVTEDRDPAKYVGETEQIKAVNEYYRVRDAAVARREALLEVLADVLENMNDDSDDFAHVAKQTALVEVIQGQLQVCSNDINNAYNDVAVKGLQVYTLNSVKSKGDAEPMVNEMEEKSDDLAAKLDEVLKDPGMPSKPSGGAVSTSGFLPWPTRS